MMANQDTWDLEPVLKPGASITRDLKVLEHLGGSGKVEIYLCRSRRLKERVVCKLLRPEHRQDESAVRAVLREGQILSAMDHPNVARGFGAFLEPVPHALMEHLEGQTLSNAFFRGNYEAFDLADFVEVAVQLAEALSHVHSKGYLHLDVKPSNIHYDDGHVTLFDFSVAREFCPECGLRNNAGTTEYMAPEQTFREPLGYHTDVFGLGVVFYRLLTGGRLPYRTIDSSSDADGDIKERLDYGILPEPPSRFNPAVEDMLDEVSLRALSPDRGHRHQGPEAFRLELQHALDSGRCPE